MEFILDQDYLAVVSKDQYSKMKTAADENEAKKNTVSTAEAVVNAITTAAVVGALGYVGYQCFNVISQESKDSSLRRENYDLLKELDELKRHMGDK